MCYITLCLFLKYFLLGIIDFKKHINSCKLTKIVKIKFLQLFNGARQVWVLLKVYSTVQERYRQEGLAADIKQARLGIILLMAPLVFYIFNDYYFFGISPEFFSLAALRFSFLFFTVVILGYFNRLNNFRLYDRSIFLWGFVGVVITTLINASRPQNFLFHVIIVLSMIAITYFVIPQKHINRTIIASGLTLGLIVNLFTGLQTLAISALISIFVSLALVNLSGSLFHGRQNLTVFPRFYQMKKILI